MASAMLAGLFRACPGLACHVIEPNIEARQRLAALGVIVHAAVEPAALHNADAVVLAVKPQSLRDACGQLAPYLRGELIVSIAAGIRIATLSRWLHGHMRVVRTMPNTPALIGRGMTGLFAPDEVSAEDVNTALELMRSCGEVIRVESEAMIDAVTAVSGSGPAYVFHWIESMQRAASEIGFSDADARTLVLATLKGATALADASAQSPAVLREQVTSKGGTTAAALDVMADRGVQQALVDAVLAARDRGEALGTLLDRE